MQTVTTGQLIVLARQRSSELAELALRAEQLQADLEDVLRRIGEILMTDETMLRSLRDRELEDLMDRLVSDDEPMGPPEDGGNDRPPPEEADAWPADDSANGDEPLPA